MALNNAVKSSKSRRKWKNTEQCREPELARAQERKRNTQKIDSEGERTFQINSRDEINVQACKNSHIIRQVIHKRNQTLFVRVFRNTEEKVVDSLIRRKDNAYFSLYNFCCKFYRDDLPWLKWIANLR